MPSKLSPPDDRQGPQGRGWNLEDLPPHSGGPIPTDEQGRPIEAEAQHDPMSVVRTLTISLAAAGAVLLLGAMALRLGGLLSETPQRLMVTPVGLAMAAAEWMGFLILPGVIFSVGFDRLVREGSEGPAMAAAANRLMATHHRLAELLAGSRIIALLMLGGASLFLTVAYLIEGQWYLLPFAAVTLGMLTGQYMGQEATSQWLAQQSRDLDRQQRDRRDELDL